MTGLRLSGCVAAAMVGLCGAPALAQTPAKTVNVIADPGNLSGVWISARFNPNLEAEAQPGLNPQIIRTVDGKAPPLQPWAQAVADQRLQAMKAGRPIPSSKAKCLPAGTPQSMAPPAALPIQILETPGQVTILFEEFNQFRIIHMNAKHQADPDPGYFGDSVGHWDGDTLVVDTIGLKDTTTIDNVGIPHSEDLHMVERFHRTGADTMEILTTMDDPKAFTAPWTIRSAFKRAPGMKLAEYFCDNDRNPPDATGRTGILLPSASH